LTAIEYAIVSTQLPAVYFFASGSLKSFSSSLADVQKYKRLLIEVDRFRFDDIGADDSVGPEIVSATLRHALTNELNQSRRQFKVGVSQFLIAIAFVYFSLNTLHIRFPAHPTAVINAVGLLLLGLSYLLYTLVLSIHGKYTSARRAHKLKKRLRNSANGNSLEEILSLVYRAGFGEDLMGALVALTAEPSTGSSPLEFQYKASAIEDYEAAVASDLETVRDALQGLREEAAAGTDAKGTPRRQTRSKSRASTSASQVPAALLHSLDAHIRAQYRSAGLSAAFFLLNFAAGYGYLMPILAFYAPHEQQPAGSVLGALLKLVMFAQPSAVADWWGNMVGDVAWTVEPLLVMFSPAIMKAVEKVSALFSPTSSPGIFCQ
jgi:hypothetical protein